MINKLIPLILCSGALLTTTTASISHENTPNDIPSSRGIDAKGMLSTLASSLMSRGFVTGSGGTGSGSQVVSLNLTNLFVLVLLKALIFAAGSLGAGTWKGGMARSNDGEETLFTDDEVLLFLSYLTGAPGDNGCLQSVACQQPQQAKKYVTAGDMLLKASKIFALDPDRSYDYVLKEVDVAAEAGLKGGDCSRFSCGATENKP